MIVDANVLLYAVDEQSHFHTTARTWLEEALNGDERVGLPWASLMAFQRIITHPRVTATPLTAAQAWGFVTDWLDADPVSYTHLDVYKRQSQHSADRLRECLRSRPRGRVARPSGALGGGRSPGVGQPGRPLMRSMRRVWLMVGAIAIVSGLSLIHI